MTRALLALISLIAFTVAAHAHEMRPGYLDMRESAANQFSVVWKIPAAGDRRLGIYLRLPQSCVARREPVRTIENAYFFERFHAICADGIKGQTIAIDGLRATMTDVLARIQYLDGTFELGRLTPEAPVMEVRGQQTVWQVAWTYFSLGVEHILSGYDHLLFVLALMLLIDERWMLVKTISAFTLAHTITLGGASLGYFSLPQKPVEAAIALSIAFVASELVKMKPGARRTSETYPWLVAFAFGLLHGFGFAGALKDVGLPQSDVPVALLTFNLGVEAGQLMFVTAVLIAYGVVRALISFPFAYSRVVAAYLIGTFAMVWLVMRLAAA